VFVTGANGFIGAALVDRLRALGHDVAGVDLRPDPAAGVVAGSTTEPETWADALHGVATVIHTAAVVSNVATHEQAWRVNVLGTRRVLEAATAAGVGRFVHLSSVYTFGYDYPDGVDETYPIRVTGDIYPDTRVNSEAVVWTAHAAGEIGCTVIRPGDVYGPDSVWVREPLRMIKAGQMVLPDAGRGTFTPIYIDDLVDGILLAAASPAAAGQVFTLTDDSSVTCADYFGRLADMADGSVRSLPGITVGAVGAVGALMRALGRDNELTAATMRYLQRPGGYSNRKAREVLGFAPRTTLDDGMRAVEAWARAEGLL